VAWPIAAHTTSSKIWSSLTPDARFKRVVSLSDLDLHQFPDQPASFFFGLAKPDQQLVAT